ncbi:hypothetical protein WG66_002034 [Moniliophthora roreri]|nr:hypothetical protein WG66_002034 [Moniliophthora roreri]
MTSFHIPTAFGTHKYSTVIPLLNQLGLRRLKERHMLLLLYLRVVFFFSRAPSDVQMHSITYDDIP